MIVLENIRYRRGDFCLRVDRLVLGTGLHLVVGRNGAGKSTFLQILATAVFPDAGTISYNGYRVENALPRIRRQIGFLPSNLEPYGHMTPRRFLGYMAQLKGVAGEAETERVLRVVGLLECRDVRIAKLSRGMQQRLGIAQALLGSPAVLLLDEPLNALDGGERRMITAFLGRYASGRWVVAAVHEPDEWDRVDGLLWLEDGNVVFSGPPAKWKAGLSHSVWAGAVDGEDFARLDPRRILGSRFWDDRVEVRCFSRERPGDGFREDEPTLEEAYLIRRYEREESEREEGRG
ncbi:MAG: ATP-binding cassette domain-containing protein [Alicyclobacillaceae bacterium]|nr:ATP-binding cassette domain-containing protein [Alicyclobacillaceae bacterium]